MNWLEEILDGYYRWLKENTELAECEESGWHRMVTPFVGLFNDNIEIYVRKDGDRIILSDDGLTLAGLEQCGLDFAKSSKRKEMLDSVLRNYGIGVSKHDEMTVMATVSDFAQKKHDMICAIEELSSLEYMAEHSVAGVFKEDVRRYLDENRIVCNPEFIARGRTGINFTFDFQIAGMRSEAVIKPFGSLDKSNVPKFLFALDDVREEREKITGKEMYGIAIIDDRSGGVKEEYVHALESRDVKIITWDRRNDAACLDLLKVA